jgi:hypothetical protein
MAIHSYEPQDALNLLLRKLREEDESLAERVEAAIDVGKDVSDTEPLAGKVRRSRIYRKAVPYTHQEALAVALDVLQSFFVEQAMFVNSASEVFAKAAVAVASPNATRFSLEGSQSFASGEGEEKAIVIELETETQINKTGEAEFRLHRFNEKDIQEQRSNIRVLQELIRFGNE